MVMLQAYIIVQLSDNVLRTSGNPINILVYFSVLLVLFLNIVAIPITFYNVVVVMARVMLSLLLHLTENQIPIITLTIVNPSWK